jgi:hypothetical protein
MVMIVIIKNVMSSVITNTLRGLLLQSADSLSEQSVLFVHVTVRYSVLYENVQHTQVAKSFV